MKEIEYDQYARQAKEVALLKTAEVWSDSSHFANNTSISARPQERLTARKKTAVYKRTKTMAKKYV